MLSLLIWIARIWLKTGGGGAGKGEGVVHGNVLKF